EIVRVAAPVYLKFGLRNAPNIYPSGLHLEPTAVSLTRERLRRARVGLDLLARLYPEAAMSPLPEAGPNRATGCAIVTAFAAEDDVASAGARRRSSERSILQCANRAAAAVALRCQPLFARVQFLAIAIAFPFDRKRRNWAKPVDAAA